MTTGIVEIDRLVGGVLPGDNIVLEVDSGAPVDRFISSFLAVCEAEGSPVAYVSFNRSPQTISRTYAGLMSHGAFRLVDCFSSGKGNNDSVFLDFYESPENDLREAVVRVENPSDAAELERMLAEVGSAERAKTRYVFDSLTGMLDLWGDEDVVLRFFGHICPRLFDLSTIAYWLLETEAHSSRFLAKVRHITQVVLEIGISRGIRTLTLRKAANRRSTAIGVPQWFRVVDGKLAIATESREDRELSLLTRMGEALGTALVPNSFFEETMNVLASELGMIRGTVVLLDRTTGKLRIVAAHGLSSAERARGQYDIGEGVTGSVVKTGLPEAVPDISQDARFLNRTSARQADSAWPIAFICVPLKVDNETVGALSVDRPFAVESTLDKDLRLLSIVASLASQVLKINRVLQVEKEEILVRDEQMLRELRSRYRLENLIGQSKSIQHVLVTAATAAKSNAPILISGETGTGKELVANVIHYNSPRSKGPLVKVNCGALPETLLESELFGHVKGAFTGAIQNRKGRFELAHQGTLFLDEVSEMSPRLQVKLLRVLQENEFEPVGGTQTIRVDVRVVAATNTDLKEAIRQGRFRHDLYYRLNVVPIHLPALRERREDIPMLVDHFLEKYNRENGKTVTKISREVLDHLLAYSWPGNVRELENCVEHAVVMSPGKTLSMTLLPAEILNGTSGGPARWRQPSPDALQSDLRMLLDRYYKTAEEAAGAREELHRLIERIIISRALGEGMSQRTLAAKLGLSRTTLHKRLQEYGLGS
ncbi:MAG: sigma 54-interacting transcriptional regulator [Sedimentisphaerales bacterium]|nr:sigma 54-interacting transcriptional regulator [Sedimentisphaerales bacterium]